MTHSPLPWTFNWTNDVGPDDDYYVEFFEIRDTGGNLIAKVEEEKDAKFIVDSVNTFVEIKALANLRKEIPLIGKHSVDYEEGFWDGLAAYEAAIRARSEKSPQPKGFQQNGKSATKNPHDHKE